MWGLVGNPEDRFSHRGCNVTDISQYNKLIIADSYESI